MTAFNMNKNRVGLDIISLETYLQNCRDYSFERFVFPNEWGAIKNDCCESKESPILSNQSSYVYILINTGFLVENMFWSQNQKVEFVFDLIEFLDFKKERFEILKRLIFDAENFALKFRCSLRNIGVYPINLTIKQRLLENTCNDLSLAALFYPNEHFRYL